MTGKNSLKYERARETVYIARIYLQKRDPESVYKSLMDNFFFWNEKRQRWQFETSLSAIRALRGE